MENIQKLMKVIAEQAVKELEKLDSAEKELSFLLSTGKKNSKEYVDILCKANYLDGYVRGLHTAYLQALTIYTRKEVSNID